MSAYNIETTEVHINIFISDSQYLFNIPFYRILDTSKGNTVDVSVFINIRQRKQAFLTGKCSLVLNMIGDPSSRCPRQCPQVTNWQ